MLDKVFHNRTSEPIGDGYGQSVPVGGSRVRTEPCVCPVPCRKYHCSGCRKALPWCLGGGEDERCDDCVGASTSKPLRPRPSNEPEK